MPDSFSKFCLSLRFLSVAQYIDLFLPYQVYVMFSFIDSVNNRMKNH